MKVLLTGAFGNIGESTLLALLEKNYQIRCFDLYTKRNEKISKKLVKQGDFETLWGIFVKYQMSRLQLMM